MAQDILQEMYLLDELELDPHSIYLEP